MGPFELSAIATVAVVLGVVTVLVGRPLVNNLSELLRELRRDRKVVSRPAGDSGLLLSAVDDLQQRVARLEEGLAFVEQLQRGETPRPLPGAEPGRGEEPEAQT